MINPSNNDSWALISLYNINGQNIELKFVDRMKRQFQFSVDSFQISIDSLLNYYEQMSKYQQATNKKQQYHHGKHQLLISGTAVGFLSLEFLIDERERAWFAIAQKRACAK